MVRYGVFIGRFQPFHNGHLKIVNLALGECDRALVVIAHTSSRQELLRQQRYPISVEDRRAMITASIESSALRRLSLATIYNRDDWVAWCGDLDDLMAELACRRGDDSPEFVLYGCCKDASTRDYLEFIQRYSCYLKTNRFIDPVVDAKGEVIHGSDIRGSVERAVNVPPGARQTVFDYFHSRDPAE